MVKNKFCDKDDLTNESSVEQFFAIRLIKNLDYKDKNIKPKKSIRALTIGKGSKKELYKPDYVLFVRKKPRIVIDAKDPNENVDKYIYQTSGYSLALNQKYEKENPVRYFILLNGIVVKLYRWDEEKPILVMKFEDFTDKNKKYKELQKLISFGSLSTSIKQATLIDKDFEFEKPPLSDLDGIFRACHQIIWKKEKIKPTEAFFEFSKLFFIKVYYDREIHKLKRKPKMKDFVFSVSWIEENEKVRHNPVKDILFEELRNKLEEEIMKKKRKRIFEKNEKLNLKPSTIKEVVKLLEHLDLFGIDEDLNGRMFETFLSATIRGKDLGQFFTPRSVVKFMTEIADLKVSKDHIDTVLDACCGSGGFLIDAMIDMFEKIRNNKTLTNVEKEKMIASIVQEHLWGIDADKKISRIARMNMYLHGDGSNRIYWIPDSLDKDIEIEEGIDEELKMEAEEFKEKIMGGFKFDVVLTNPPFSMRYSAKDVSEKKLIREYDIAYKYGKGESKKLKSSLKSNVLFLERYRDLLKPHGKLITIIDESVLNADSEKDFRDFIRKNFIIKAIISLPKNTFVNADTGVKTSVLYLMKKERKDEEQPEMFMAISKNVGHSDAGKRTSKLNDLPQILKRYKAF